MKWTEDTVKGVLPDIQVKMNGKTYLGSVSGRLEKFAQVTVKGGTFEFSWAALVRSLNTNTPLLV